MDKPAAKLVAQAFGETLRERRTHAGLSQEALALSSGFDRTYISLLERGGRQPTLTTIIAFAEILGISASDLCKSTLERYDQLK